MRNGRLLSIVAALAVVLVVVAVIAAVRSFRASSSVVQALPVIVRSGLSHEEGCLTCHRTTRGVGIAHAAIGCSPCHLGDPRAREANAAHRGMEILAGDFATVARTCGASDCHPAETARVQRSLMARAPGILAVDRFAFGERARPDGDDDDDLVSLSRKGPPYSNAESHARQLCASCHLSARKERAGDLGTEARGGGCAACHLGPPAGRRATGDGPLHPDVSAAVPERRCEGCHSRSGRIALSFHGKVELLPGDPKITGALPDGRPTGSASADVHAAAGMTCIDCHTEREVMGDGELRRHVGEGRDVTCADCHRIAAVSSATDADREAVAERLRAGWTRRGLPPLSSGAPIHTRSGTPLWRTDRVARSLALVTSGERRAIPEASARAYHALPGHERLDCQACHSSWAPRCPTCHTRFDPGGEGVDLVTGARVSGRWIEESGAFGLGPPSLAVTRGERIGPFVLGMNLRIDGTSEPAIERTLWAPLDPHTTSASRPCASCHASGDAYPLVGETTRTSARLLDAAERERVARVGRCISCHPRYDDAVYANFGASVTRLRGRLAGTCKGKLD